MKRISLRWRVARNQTYGKYRFLAVAARKHSRVRLPSRDCEGAVHSSFSSSLVVVVLAVCLTVTAMPATRPHYGGTLRVEVRESSETAAPPSTGKLALGSGFTMERWEGGRRAVYTADPAAPGGRPFLDTVEILMGRSLLDQSASLSRGRADVVEYDPNDTQRSSSRKTWSSSPVRLLVLVFGARVEDTR